MSDESIETPDGDSTHTLAYARPNDSDAASDRMTRGDVACLCVRILGIYLIVESLPFLEPFFDDSYVRYGRFINFSRLGMASIPFVVTAGVGTAMAIWSRLIGGWLLPRTAVVATEPPGHGPAQLQAIAFSVVGVLLVVWSMPYLTWLMVRIVIFDSRSNIQPRVLDRIEENLPALAHYGVELTMGVWLFFGSKGLAAWWWKIRHPEIQKPDGGDQG